MSEIYEICELYHEKDELLFNIETDQSAPDVAMDSGGTFMVIWQSKDQDGIGIFK